MRKVKLFRKKGMIKVEKIAFRKGKSRKNKCSNNVG